MIAYAQLETIIDSAAKLGQAGIVAMLLFFVLILVFAIRSLFIVYQANTEAALTAITENTKAMEAHTRALEANSHAAMANREAISNVRVLVESIFSKRNRVS